jgi:hypothetical protein
MPYFRPYALLLKCHGLQLRQFARTMKTKLPIEGPKATKKAEMEFQPHLKPGNFKTNEHKSHLEKNWGQKVVVMEKKTRRQQQY